MMFKTHLALGILSGILAIRYLNPDSMIVFGSVLVIASLIPDIDISRSKVGKKFRPISSMIGFLFGHRGLVHTIYIPIIAWILAYIYGYTELGTAFFLGYGVHLAADMATVQGIMPLFPFSKAKAAGFIRTGKIAEHAILVLSVACIFKEIL